VSEQRARDHSDEGASWVHEHDSGHDKTLVENWLLRLRQERFRSRQSGKTHDFFVAYVADGVHTIALTEDNHIVMVRQFRAGSRRDSLETPGGLLEPGEDPCAAGARELLEETGYAGEPGELLFTIWPNPALLTMCIATVVIRGARLVSTPRLDPAEEIELELVPVHTVHNLIKTGRIDHAVCVAGLLRWLAWP
jgi:8-oxo-dGTP pyrophosphatase MutT (NUDIX family)